MTFEEFEKRILDEIESATNDLYDKRNVLDLRASRYPYDTIRDNDIFDTAFIYDAWHFVKDAEEWYVDVYENYAGENLAEYTGFSVASWENN